MLSNEDKNSSSKPNSSVLNSSNNDTSTSSTTTTPVSTATSTTLKGDDDFLSSDDQPTEVTRCSSTEADIRSAILDIDEIAAATVDSVVEKQPLPDCSTLIDESERDSSNRPLKSLLIEEPNTTIEEEENDYDDGLGGAASGVEIRELSDASSAYRQPPKQLSLDWNKLLRRRNTSRLGSHPTVEISPSNEATEAATSGALLASSESASSTLATIEPTLVTSSEAATGSTEAAARDPNINDLSTIACQTSPLESKIISRFDRILSSKKRVIITESLSSSVASSPCHSKSNSNSSLDEEFMLGVKKKSGCSFRKRKPLLFDSSSSKLNSEPSSGEMIEIHSMSINPASDISFYDVKNSQRMLASLNQMRLSDGSMCDVVLRVSKDFVESKADSETETETESETFPCHRCVLASLSDYFRAMFSSELAESRQTEIRLNGIDAATMRSIIEFVYTSRLNINPNNVQTLLAAANLYDFKAIKTACANFMKWRLEPSNCIGIYLFADVYDCSRLKKSSFKYILENFTKVSKHDEFLSISQNLLIDIIKNDDLNVANEDLVYDACVKWLKHSFDSRIEQFYQVFENVRLPLVSTYHLHDVVKKDERVINCPKCAELVEQALDFNLVKERRSELQSKRTRPRNLFEVLEAMVIHDGRTVDVYFPSIDCWIALKNCPYPYRKNGMTSTGSDLYFCGGEFPPTNSFFRYNSIYNEWREMPNLKNSRTELILINLDGFIYAMGGRDKWGSQLTSVERYDPYLNEWKSCAPMKRAFMDATSATLKGKIYIIEQTSVHVYDPREDEWQELDSPMPTQRSGCAACSFQGLIYVLGGWSGTNTSCVEYYDPSLDKWHRDCASMLEARYKPMVATLDNAIYVCASKACKSLRNPIERYDPDTNQWSHVATLKSGSYWLTCTNLMLLNPLIYNIYDERESSLPNETNF